MITICVKCKYHLGPAVTLDGVRIDHFCGAITHQQVLDPVTGEMTYDEGHIHPYCRDINRDGNCGMYEAVTQ